MSRLIKTLEDDLGFALLIRTTRRVELTAAGVVLAEHGKVALDQLGYAVRSAKMVAAGKAGAVTVAYSLQTAYGLIPRVALRFRGDYPQAEVNLHLMSSNEQLDAIRNGTIDVGFLLTAVCNGQFAHVPLSRERFIVVASKYADIAQHDSIALQELKSQRFILGTLSRWGPFRSLIDNACRQVGFLPNVVEEADDMPVLLRLVAMNRGITLFAESLRGSLPPDLIAIALTDKHVSFELSMAWNEDRRISLVQKFVDCAKQIATEDRLLVRGMRHASSGSL